jgi:hypothetical protein
LKCNIIVYLNILPKLFIAKNPLPKQKAITKMMNHNNQMLSSKTWLCLCKFKFLIFLLKWNLNHNFFIPPCLFWKLPYYDIQCHMWNEINNTYITLIQTKHQWTTFTLNGEVLRLEFILHLLILTLNYHMYWFGLLHNKQQHIQWHSY